MGVTNICDVTYLQSFDLWVSLKYGTPYIYEVLIMVQWVSLKHATLHIKLWIMVQWVSLKHVTLHIKLGIMD